MNFTNQERIVILSAAKDVRLSMSRSSQILRCAQDDKQAFSVLVVKIHQAQATP